MLQPKTCSCSKDPRRKFSPGKPSPEPRAPEPPNLSRGPQPYRLSPTPAEPYGRALAKPKRWQDIQPKPTPSTHPFCPPTSPPTRPRATPTKTGAIDKNPLPKVPATAPEVIQFLAVFGCIKESFWKPANIIANLLGSLQLELAISERAFSYFIYWLVGVLGCS